MGNDPSCVALGLNVWKTHIDRADKLFGALSSEEVLREIAPGRNRVLCLWGHLTAAHDAMLPLLGLRERLHPEFDVAFISNPDNVANICGAQRMTTIYTSMFYPPPTLAVPNWPPYEGNWPLTATIVPGPAQRPSQP